MKNRKRTGVLLIIIGLAMVVIPVVLFFIERHKVMEHASIIGGADLPTFLYLQRFGGFPRVPVFVSAGSALVTVGVLLCRGRIK